MTTTFLANLLGLPAHVGIIELLMWCFTNPVAMFTVIFTVIVIIAAAAQWLGIFSIPLLVASDEKITAYGKQHGLYHDHHPHKKPKPKPSGSITPGRAYAGDYRPRVKGKGHGDRRHAD